MALIVAGSAIGIKFRRNNNEEFCSHMDNSGRFCIHNGRFRFAQIGGQRVTSFDTANISSIVALAFNHAGRCVGGAPRFSEIDVFNVVDVRVIPAFNYTYRDFLNPGGYVSIQNYCQGSRPGSDYYDDHKNDADKILPTMPIAFCYTTASGGTDVHNGRYLFWQDSALNRHCVLHMSDQPYRLWYSHMVFDANGNLVPELRFRENILSFAKIPS